MNIIISNAVTLNGGDYAILDSMIKVIRQSLGDDTKFIVYDNNSEIAGRYYPNISYRKLIDLKYRRKGGGRVQAKLQSLVHAWNRRKMLAAARAMARGNTMLPKLLLSAEQHRDLSTYQSADLVITTGGTYLVENYPLDSRIFDFRLTLALKKPLVFFTQSLGPYRRPANIAAFRDIFNRANLILLRDHASLNHLKQINVNVSKAHICADVVFADADPKLLGAAAGIMLPQSPRVAISVREWAYFKGQSAKSGMSNYNESVAALCEFICRAMGGEVVFISTCQGIKEYRDDSQAAHDVMAILPEDVRARCSVNAQFHTPDELKQIIKRFDLVVSTRMHFAIQSLCMGIPVFPIAYEFKTRELFKRLIPEDIILDIDTINPTTAVESFGRYCRELPNFRKYLFSQVDEERRSALRAGDYLKELV